MLLRLQKYDIFNILNHINIEDIINICNSCKKFKRYLKKCDYPCHIPINHTKLYLINKYPNLKFSSIINN